MNYTTLAKVKLAMGASETTDDTLIKAKIDEASRVIDVTLCKAEPDYFKLETITAEIIKGIITKDGDVVCWAKKAVVNSVTSFEYRLTPRTPWIAVDASYVEISNRRQLRAYGVGGYKSTSCQVRITYSGGYGTEASDPAVITGLPADIINAATVMTVRLYKEEKGGLTDAIGVAELGTMQYTKAIPARVVEETRPYWRIVS